MERIHNSILWRYILNSSFHGFRYIAEPNRHWTERVFWIIFCSVSWCMSGLVISSTWNSFQTSAISFVVETSYINWDTQFPAIHVCEVDNEEKIAKISDRLFGDPHDYNFDEIVKELAFFSGHFFFTLEMCGRNVKEPSEVCYKENFSQIALEKLISRVIVTLTNLLLACTSSPKLTLQIPRKTMVKTKKFLLVKARSSCMELFRQCKWNNVDFSCCRFFSPVNSDLGLCYAINSLQTRTNNPKMQMISNKVLGTGSLVLELNGYSNIYILGSLEVPSVITSNKDFIEVSPHVQAKRTFSIKDIENQVEVKDLSIKQRKCRYAEENYLDVSPYYSYSTCLMQCRKDAQLKKCGCAHHLMPNTSSEKQCTFSGLECYQKHFQELMVQKPASSPKLGLECDCLPSCNEIQLDVITESKQGYSEDYSILQLSLERLPTERYKRYVVKGTLDLAVSIGSAIALFLGASFLSFIEIFFYFLVRPLSDYFQAHTRQK